MLSVELALVCSHSGETHKAPDAAGATVLGLEEHKGG